MHGGVHHRQRHQFDVGRALLAHDPRAERAGVAGGEPGALAESQAGVVPQAGALHPQRGVVVPETQVVEADAAHIAGLRPQHRHLLLQRLLALRRREGPVQRHLAPHRVYGGGEIAPLALVGAPRGAVELVAVAPDEEDGRAQPATPGGLEQVGDVVPRVVVGQIGECLRSAPLDRPRDAPGRVPPDAVDVVREVHGPVGGGGQAERRAQRRQVPLHRGLFDVEALDVGECAAGEGQAAEAVAVAHAVFVPAG